MDKKKFQVDPLACISSPQKLWDSVLPLFHKRVMANMKQVIQKIDN